MHKRIGAALVILGLNINAATPAMSDDTGLADSLHMLKRERGRLCMDGHYHYGNGDAARSKSSALRMAVKDWRGFVAWEYGTDWARWRRAANRTRNCQRLSGGYWKCNVEARPCK